MSKIEKIWKIFDTVQKKNIIILIVMMIFGMLLELLGISSIIPLIFVIFDQNSFFVKYSNSFGFFELINMSTENIIWFFLALIGFIYLFKFFYLSLLSWKLNKFIFDLNANISKRLLFKYLSKDILFHSQKNSSELISNIIIESTKHSQQVVGPALRLLSEIVVFFGIIILLLYFEPYITFSALFIFVILSSIFIMIFSPYIVNWGNIRISNEKLRIQHAKQSIEGIKEIKLENVEDKFIEEFEKPNNLALKAQTKHTTLLEIPRYGIELVALLMVIFLIIYLSVNGKNNSELLVILGIFSAATLRILPSINKVLVAFQNLKFGIPVIDKIYEELKTNNKEELLDKNKDNRIHFKKSLKINNISFKYPNRENNIVENLNYKFDKGKSYGIYGDSGSGKSTIISILTGLIEPSEGSILVDNININQNIKSWMNNISLVSQKIFLLDDSIKNNILLGTKQLDEKELSNVIRLAKLDELIASLPNKINTTIGELGAMLSGGQIQRIGIARALYKNPELLILDESTNALDTQTEKELLNDLYNIQDRCTKIFVSHKMSVLEKCDIILKVENKKISLIK